MSVANTEVSGVKEFESVLSKADKSKPDNVLYRRGEWAQYALIRPGKCERGRGLRGIAPLGAIPYSERVDFAVIAEFLTGRSLAPQ